MSVPVRGDVSLIVGFGTDMGTAEDIAKAFADGVADIGLPVSAVELNQIDITQLLGATHLVTVCSTFGDGEFPDCAQLFWEALSAEDVQRLDHLSFAVLALGDTSYDHFCNAGKLLDGRLEDLGATRLVDRVDIDGIDDQPVKAWMAEVVDLLAAEQSALTTPKAVAADTSRLPTTKPVAHDRHAPVEARLTVNQLLTAPDSDREVRHYEVDLTGTGIRYQAGDSLAVHAPNDPALVDLLLRQLEVDADFTVYGHEASLGTLLAEHFEIRTPSRALRDLVGAAAYGEDVLDLVRRAGLTAQQVIDTLRPLNFRDYSIASSPLVHPDHAHLTVATVRYAWADRTHGGVASTFLADRSETLRVHLRSNNTFRLPDPDVPIVMIGPGTGIAPFRGFLQERRQTAASGRSWLFFGDRRRAKDFLYGDELADFHAGGTLTRLDLAFSRDRPDGVRDYVQHRMQEYADDLFGWLQDGAYVYVCGDEKRMAKDVDATLRGIIQDAGKMDADTAHGYVNDLIKSHRYVRDVY